MADRLCSILFGEYAVCCRSHIRCTICCSTSWLTHNGRKYNPRSQISRYTYVAIVELSYKTKQITSFIVRPYIIHIFIIFFVLYACTGEPFERNHLYGTVIIVIASVLLVIFGPEESDDISLDELKANYIQIGFVIFSLVLTAVAIWIYSGVKYYEMLNAEADLK